MRCKYCKATVRIGERHSCPELRSQTGHGNHIVADDSDFLLSAAVGYATGNAALGALAGGDLLGGVIGAGLHGDEDERSTPEYDSDNSGGSDDGDSSE